MRTFIVTTFCCLAAIQSNCVADDKIEWIDYCAKINEACKPPGVPDSENALPLLQQAAALYVEPNESLVEITYISAWPGKALTHSSPTGAQIKKLKAWHKVNHAAWQNFIEASAKEHYWQKYVYAKIDHGTTKLEDTVAIPTDDITGHRNLVRLGLSMARTDLTERKFKAAAEKCTAIIKVGCLIQYSKGFLLEHLIGAFFCRTGQEQLSYILDDAGLDENDVLFIENRLDQLQTSIQAVNSLEAENMFTRSLIQSAFSIHRSVRKTIPYTNLKKYDDLYFNFMRAFITNRDDIDLKKVAREHANFDEVMHVQKILEERNATLANLRPYQRSKLDLKEVIPEKEKMKYYMLAAYSIEGVLERGYDLLKQTRLKHEAVVVVVALKHWQFDKGSLPDALDELVAAGYITQVPEDPFSEGKIKYAKKGKSFLLYSNGHNMKDDGGTREIDEEHREKDLVFWPIAHKNTSTQ